MRAYVIGEIKVSDPARLVVLRFPDAAAARSFYDSPAYREARAERAGATEFSNMLLVDGA